MKKILTYYFIVISMLFPCLTFAGDHKESKTVSIAANEAYKKAAVSVTSHINLACCLHAHGRRL
jgi:hypothetical protein